MKDISRRDLLKQFGLAGLMVLPVLRQTRSFAAEFSPIYCQVFKPLGSAPGTYYPNGDGNNFNFTGKTTEALNGLQEYLIVPRGLRQYEEKGNHHGQGICRNFANSWVVQPDGDYTPPVSPSIDHIIAEHLSSLKQTPLKHIHFSAAPRRENNGVLHTTSFPGNKTMKLPVIDVLKMFEMVTSPINQQCSGAVTPISNESLAKQSMLDFHLNNIANAKTALDLSITEKGKLDTYAEQLRAIEKKISGMQVSSSGQKGCPVFPQKATYDPPAPYFQHSRQRSEVVFDLMVLAMEWELTNVASLMLGRAQDDHQYGKALNNTINDDYFHGLSHYGSNATNKQSYNAISTLLWSEIASFLNKLKNAKTFDGQSLLDAHCILISGGEVSDGDTHSYNDMPFILAGKAGGAIKKTGYTYPVPKNNGLDSHARLLLSVCHAMGHTGLQYVGDVDKCQGGPLIEVATV